MSMKTTTKRQRTLSFKVTEEADATLEAIRLAMSNRLGVIVTKTDVIEAAIKSLAKREKVPCE